MSRKQTYLVVDDDADDAMLMKEAIKDLNDEIEIHYAKNGVEALKMMRTVFTQLPDIIFLDLNMPMMNGKECLQEIKSDPKLQNIEVIIYTTSDQLRDIYASKSLGAIGYITKPSSYKTLKNIFSILASNHELSLKDKLCQLQKEYSFIISNHGKT
jgi:CheY-like chemotaxis protein